MTEPAILLKPRGRQPLAWRHLEVAAREVDASTSLDAAHFVAFDLETNGHAPFLVVEIGAERFNAWGPISDFETLVHCQAPINPYARRRHLIRPEMLVGAPEFPAARRAFLEFAQGAVLVEHSHDAFDSFVLGRGLDTPLEHPVFDTTAIGRMLLDLPPGQIPALARLVSELGIEITPEHTAVSDARATAAVFRALLAIGRERLGWTTVGDLIEVLPRPQVDRSRLDLEAPPAPPVRSRHRRGRSRRPRRASEAAATEPGQEPSPEA